MSDQMSEPMSEPSELGSRVNFKIQFAEGKKMFWEKVFKFITCFGCYFSFPLKTFFFGSLLTIIFPSTPGSDIGSDRFRHGGEPIQPVRKLNRQCRRKNKIFFARAACTK